MFNSLKFGFKVLQVTKRKQKSKKEHDLQNINKKSINNDSENTSNIFPNSTLPTIPSILYFLFFSLFGPFNNLHIYY